MTLIRDLRITNLESN